MASNRLKKSILGVLALCTALLMTAGLGHAAKGKPAPDAFTDADLQRELMSYSDRYAAVLAQAVDDVERLSPSPEARRVVVGDTVYSAAAAFTIAADPEPQLALLDMVVLTSLGQKVFESYWRPRLGPIADPVIAALTRLERDVWAVASPILDELQQRELSERITTFHRDNPELSTFSHLRFADFPSRRETSSLKKKSSGGIFATVRGVTDEVEQTRLLAERALYVASRLPLLSGGFADVWATRLLAHPGVAEIRTDLSTLTDSADRLAGVAEQLPDRLLAERDETIKLLVTEVNSVRFDAIEHALEAVAKERQEIFRQIFTEDNALGPLVTDVRHLVGETGTLVTSTDSLAQRFITGETGEPFNIATLQSTIVDAGALVQHLDNLVQSTEGLMDSPGAERLAPALAAAIDVAGQTGERLIDRLFLRAALLILLALVGYVIARLCYRWLASRMSGGKRDFGHTASVLAILGAALVAQALSAQALSAQTLSAQALPAAASSAAYPLEPPDLSSPLATLDTLLGSIDEAVEMYFAGDPEYRRRIAVARDCFDATGIPPKAVVGTLTEEALLLKEVLDRIELPPRSEIPDADRAESEALTAWTLPHTEIEVVLLEEGDRSGEWVFSAETAARAQEFYHRVRQLPYRPGKQGAHYDQMRLRADLPLMGTLVSRLPAWAKREVGGQLLFQWVALVLVLILAAWLALLALRVGRRRAKPVSESRGLSRLWAFVPPLTLIALAMLVRNVVQQNLRIWGLAGALTGLLMTAVAFFGAAWLTAVAVMRGAEHVIISAGIERPLNLQLIRVSSRALALLLILGWVFVGGQELGLPLTAMIAGLGVGGLAVALAAQSSIENLIGGISLFADQPVRIGDTLRLGDRIGTLEEVGLRSTKIRTLESTIITVPNAEFAKLQLENFSRKEKSLLRTSIRVRLETTGDQVRYLLRRLRIMLLEHPELEDNVMAKLESLGPAHLEIGIRAFAKTTDWARFKDVQQDVLLRALAIVEDAGTAIALPSVVEYSAKDGGTDPTRARQVEQQVAKWRELGEPPIPEFAEGAPEAAV